MQNEKIYKLNEKDFGKCYPSYFELIQTYLPEACPCFSTHYIPSNENTRYTLLITVTHKMRKYDIIKETNKNRVLIMAHGLIIEE